MDKNWEKYNIPRKKTKIKKIKKNKKKQLKKKKKKKKKGQRGRNGQILRKVQSSKTNQEEIGKNEWTNHRCGNWNCD